MQLTNGTELQGGKYRIIKMLGQGGFGITYLAENTFFEKKVALKEFFPKDFCGRDNTSNLTLGTQNNAETVEKLKARFLKEAKNIAKLDQPDIVKIHDIFEENNTAYYVMDYIEGENLNEMVKKGGALSESKAVEYIRKIGAALEYIHSRNMTHFDVKPANIMVRKSDDDPVLIDFGLSKQYDAHGDATSTLMQGVSHGYSPIELYNAGSIASFSPQTDIYSLGATLYFLVTGKVPPTANAILEEGLSFPETLSPSLADAIRAAMAVSRTKRPATIAAWLQTRNGKMYDFVYSQQQSDNEETCLIEDDCNKSNIKQDSPIIINGYEARDLGLSVLWATKDIGAFEEGEIGESFAWGDNDGSMTLKLQTSLLSRWLKGGPKVNNISGNPCYDTATKLWGGGWRMPTINEIKELFDNSQWYGLGHQLKLFGPSGQGIILDSRKHWTAESPNSKLLTFYWIIAQNKLGINFSQPSKDWADCYFPIRPVIDKTSLK